MRNARKGFTLVELIVVLVIIGILAGIAYVAYSQLIKKSHYNSVKSTAASVDHEAIALGASEQAGAVNYVTTSLNDADNGFTGNGQVGPPAVAATQWTKGAVTVAKGTGNTYLVTNGKASTCYTPSATTAASGTFSADKGALVAADYDTQAKVTALCP